MFYTELPSAKQEIRRLGILNLIPMGRHARDKPGNPVSFPINSDIYECSFVISILTAVVQNVINLAASKRILV